ncbi:MAG: hypothetical protein ACHBNF_22165 [Chromatiales bacterium]
MRRINSIGEERARDAAIGMLTDKKPGMNPKARQTLQSLDRDNKRP